MKPYALMEMPVFNLRDGESRSQGERAVEAWELEAERPGR